MDDTQISLVDLPVFDLLVQNAQRLGGFRCDDDAAGVSVDAIAERRRERVFLPRPPFALGVQIGLNVVDERLTVFRAVIRVDGLSGLFVDEQNIFVLIDNIELRRVNREVGIFLLGGVKKLVVDVKLDRIAEMEPRIAFCSLAVYLNALEADVLLKQRSGEQRNGF